MKMNKGFCALRFAGRRGAGGKGGRLAWLLAASAMTSLAAPENEPRNAILFIGDGMGVSTVTAARIFAGQQHGATGEENVLSFERFPNVALVKTYTTDMQVPDSAGTMSAIVTGVKTRNGVLSVAPSLQRGDCAGTAGAALPTLLQEAEKAGLRTGVVSTTRITHATPAAAYAHAADRNWEADAKVPKEHRALCKDIALQLVEFEHGDGVDVVLGGGRGMFLPETSADPEEPGEQGERQDGRDLVQEWLASRPGRQYAWNDAQFRAASPEGQILGLFSHSHMQFEADRAADAGGEPSLAAMTRAAIRRLSQAPRGYLLIVEGGRIDHAHHFGNAYRSLVDTVALADAVQVAMEATNPRDTLVMVTADHSHTLTISGYPRRGNPILGYVAAGGERQTDALGRPYTTLSYANGPGFRQQGALSGLWSFVTRFIGFDGENADDPQAPDYQQAAAWPLLSETHGGEDVAAYATGPGAEAVRGVMEQNALHGVLRSALLLADRESGAG